MCGALFKFQQICAKSPPRASRADNCGFMNVHRTFCVINTSRTNDEQPRGDHGFSTQSTIKRQLEMRGSYESVVLKFNKCGLQKSTNSQCAERMLLSSQDDLGLQDVCARLHLRAIRDNFTPSWIVRVGLTAVRKPRWSVAAREPVIKLSKVRNDTASVTKPPASPVLSFSHVFR